MMFLSRLSGKSGAFQDNFDSFCKAVQMGIRPAKDSKGFVFLCGANQDIGVPSARRKALIDFANKNLPFCQFFLAEQIFDELKAIGNSTQNLLDLEHNISEFADAIVIVLESPSAFCELGAFATSRSLREKIIVVNDSRFVTAQSFINHGPLAAIKDKSGQKNVIHYRMSEENDPRKADGIASIFSRISKVVPKATKAKAVVASSSLSPTGLTKDALRFVQDLIVIFGPITHGEVIQLSSTIFGKGHFDNAKHLTALLRACDLVAVHSSDSNRFYIPKTHDLNFHYPLDVNALRASVRALYWRRDNRRLVNV